MPRILVIEDDPDMRFVLSDNLTAEGYEVAGAADGREGLSQALSGAYDLVLLDLMLPDISGIEVCKQIRQKDAATPIIMLTAKGEEIDKVVGLEVGADDYVTKPFGMREFLARVKAGLRRGGGLTAAEETPCVIGPHTVDFALREVTGPRGAFRLTRYEGDLLKLLAKHRGEVLSRDRILREIWGAEPSPENRTVDNYIARLRAKLESTPSRPQHIVTAHGTGYKLV